MAARTYGQHATPTSFGAVVAAWGWPLLELSRGLPALREGALFVSLSGAAGTSSALGPKAAETRAGLARALGLQDPGRGWHTDRGPVLRIADWFAGLARGLAKMGADLGDLTMTGIAEVRLAGAGASSTMPQKQNPVAPSALVALNAQVQAQRAALEAAAVHRGQRDGGAWFAEWLALPPLVLGSAAALGVGRALVDAIRPEAETMARALDGGQGLIHAEALSFALAAALPRPEAQAAVKRLCAEAGDSGARLGDLAARDFPDLDLAPVFDPARQMGDAPETARAFAAAVKG
jgi:3-carboxy-cis,cis-muconate cycloisomerase